MLFFLICLPTSETSLSLHECSPVSQWGVNIASPCSIWACLFPIMQSLSSLLIRPWGGCVCYCGCMQDRIIARLQQPYSLDCIPVETEYQVQYLVYVVMMPRWLSRRLSFCSSNMLVGYCLARRSSQVVRFHKCFPHFSIGLDIHFPKPPVVCFFLISAFVSKLWLWMT